MEKPIIWCNPMAMCESIATTCCFWLVGYSPATFTTTLHGGVLKAVYHYTYYVGNAQAAVVRINGSWLQFTKGHVTYDYADTCIPYQEDGTWYIRRLNTNETLTLEQAKAMGIIDGVGYCTHQYSNCSYGRKLSEVETLHVGATTPHGPYTSDNSFLADHTAYQYAT